MLAWATAVKSIWKSVSRHFGVSRKADPMSLGDLPNSFHVRPASTLALHSVPEAFRSHPNRQPACESGVSKVGSSFVTS
jgi:hypothetical protein